MKQYQKIFVVKICYVEKQIQIKMAVYVRWSREVIFYSSSFLFFNFE